MIFCTACTSRELPEARVLAAALAEHHPEAPPLVVAVVGPHEAEEPFEVLDPVSLELPGWEQLIIETPLTELADRLRPLLLRHLLRTRGHDVVLLDPSVDVHGRLDAVADVLRDKPMALVPRLLEPLPDDGNLPDAGSLFTWGDLDPGLLAARPEDASFAVLSWWVDHDREARATGKSATHLALIVSTLAAARTAFANHVGLVDDLGFMVSGWNLHARPLARDDEGRTTAGGVPLRLFSFERFRADRPYWLRDDFTRIRVLDDPVLTGLCADRARRLLDAGWRPPRGIEITRQKLANGLDYDERMRRYHTWALASGAPVEDLSTPEGAQALVDFIRGKVSPVVQDGVSRLLWDVHRQRPDLQTAFPDLSGEDGRRLVEWAWDWGRVELDIPVELLPDRPGEEPMTVAEPDPDVVVELLGYLDANLGLGQAARSYLEALRAAGLPVTTRNVRAMAARAVGTTEDERDADREFVASKADAEPNVSVICLNAPQLVDLVHSQGAAVIPDHRYRIGVWAWETDVVPQGFHRAFDHVDEVWVYSRYIADVFAPLTQVPVTVAPLAVEVPDPGDEPCPVDLGDAYTFFFSFDLYSTVERKNPVGVVEAFKRAFAPGEGPRLLLKTINGERRPRHLDSLRAAIGDRPDIEVFDASLTQAQLAALQVRADCFVSLHRSEGWGLGLAEAMALGKPVIATGYSGNLDFMTPDNSYLVGYGMTHVGGETEIYPADGRWAEPDLDEAATAMRRVWENPEEAAEKGRRAQVDVLDQLSAERIGRRLRERLETVVAPVLGRRRREAEPEALDDVVELLEGDPLKAALASRTLTKGLKAGLQGHLDHRDAVIDRLVREIRELHREVDGAHAQAERAKAGTAQLERRLHELEDRIRKEKVAREEAVATLRAAGDGRS